MTEKERPQLDSLIKLLNDEDDIARIAMVQMIIHYSSELSEVLRQLQECDNVLLRKRSHQLQSLLIFKKRRADLFRIFHRHHDRFYMSDALIEMHLLWYEKDSASELADYYREFLRDFPDTENVSLEDLCIFFKSNRFNAVQDNTADCNLYLLGPVLDNCCATAGFAAALAIAVTEDLGLDLDLTIILFEHKFYLLDRKRSRIADIIGHWAVRDLDFSNYKTFDRTQIMRYIGSMCFANAVHDDAFRYVRILGELLSHDCETDSLPYPYSGSK